MNERIAEILNQPAFDRLKDWHDIGPVQKATLELFAEFIVRECICQCDDENSQKYIMSHFRSLLPIGFTEKDWS